jgi:hypothetical protein
LIENGTIINTDRPPDQMDPLSREVFERGCPPPPDAIPLDDATHQFMRGINLHPVARPQKT